MHRESGFLEKAISLVGFEEGTQWGAKSDPIQAGGQPDATPPKAFWKETIDLFPKEK